MEKVKQLIREEKSKLDKAGSSVHPTTHSFNKGYLYGLKKALELMELENQSRTSADTEEASKLDKPVKEPRPDDSGAFVKTYSNDLHDFYAESPNYRYEGLHGTFRGRLFNIVPKDSPAPTTGYFQPVYILNLKGYGDKALNVKQAFEQYFIDNPGS